MAYFTGLVCVRQTDRQELSSLSGMDLNATVCEELRKIHTATSLMRVDEAVRSCKRQCIVTTLHDVASRKIVAFTVAAVRI